MGWKIPGKAELASQILGAGSQVLLEEDEPMSVGSVLPFADLRLDLLERSGGG